MLTQNSSVQLLPILLRRNRPVAIVLDKHLNVICAESEALIMLAESDSAFPNPGDVTSSLKKLICENLDGDSHLATGVALLGDLVIHFGTLRGRDDFFVILLERFVSRDVLEQSVRRYSLSKREREVLSLVFLGHSANEIGRQLGISRTTVSDHLTNLLRKTESRNRSEMLAKLMNS